MRRSLIRNDIFLFDKQQIAFELIRVVQKHVRLFHEN